MAASAGTGMVVVGGKPVPLGMSALYAFAAALTEIVGVGVTDLSSATGGACDGVTRSSSSEPNLVPSCLSQLGAFCRRLDPAI